MSQRISWIDNLKAFTIFTVVAGHMMSCRAFGSEMGCWTYWNLIIPFHMPVFAALSGWFFKPDAEAGSFLKKKCQGILLPYVVWSILWFFVRPLAELAAEGNLHPGSIVWQVRFLLGDGLCRYGWWFLRALFFCFLLAFASAKVCRGRMLLAAFGSCLLLYGLTWGGVVPNMPEKDSLLKGFVYLYPFFWTGYAFRQKEAWLAAQSKWLLPASVVVFVVMLCFWQKADSFYAMNTSAVEVSGLSGMLLIWKTCWRYLVGACGSLFLVLLFARFCNSGSNRILTFVGQETLGIYILQSLVYWNLPSHPLFLELGNSGNFVLSLLVSLCIVALACLVVRLSSKRPALALALWGKK